MNPKLVEGKCDAIVQMSLESFGWSLVVLRQSIHIYSIAAVILKVLCLTLKWWLKLHSRVRVILLILQQDGNNRNAKFSHERHTMHFNGLYLREKSYFLLLLNNNIYV